MKSKKILSFAAALPLILLLGSCQTAKNGATALPDKNSGLSLVFAGDIMAHAPNYRPGNFDKIWRDIKPLVSGADLAFANVEAPVADSIPWSTYPQFNMHSEYVEAAIKAGFNVFSLANNHTNDQYLKGMMETKRYFDTRNGVWACGLKENSGDPLTYKIIEKGGWKILFVAITELLNSGDFAGYIDYYPSTEKRRSQLIGELKGLRASSECDLFVLSIHCDEPEYELSVTENHRAFYKKIIEECGADIIWANHPHVVKPFEETAASTLYTEKLGQKNRRALIMYANGNTISAQRTNPQFTAPATPRDNTGDGLILKIKAEKTPSGEVTLSDLEPHLISTYITPGHQYVVKMLEDGFIEALDRAEIESWAGYLRERKKIMEGIIKK